MNNILELSKKYFSETQRIRHHLHENPEVGLSEIETSKFIKEELTKLGIEFQEMFNTGISAIIKGGKPGKTVLLRADIDALEVDEIAEVSYKSKKKGFMHACGHDGHTAGLLGAAMILNELKDELHGNVKLMFQPAEESVGGAKPMIEAGILENPKVDAAFGLHLWGPVKRGKVAVKTGAMMASPDAFTATIKGKGTHAAMPNLGIDPIIIAAQAINEMQTIVSRQLNPLRPAVLSITTIHGGTVGNVIPQEVTFQGSVRTLDEETRAFMPKKIELVLQGLSLTYGSDYNLEYVSGYPALINDAAMSKLANDSISKIIGQENVYELEDPTMGGEDFAYLAQAVPSSFFFVGIAEENKPEPVHHHPAFAWEDDVLIESSAYLAQIAFDFLNNN